MIGRKGSFMKERLAFKKFITTLYKKRKGKGNKLSC